MTHGRTLRNNVWTLQALPPHVIARPLLPSHCRHPLSTIHCRPSTVVIHPLSSICRRPSTVVIHCRPSAVVHPPSSTVVHLPSSIHCRHPLSSICRRPSTVAEEIGVLLATHAQNRTKPPKNVIVAEEMAVSSATRTYTEPGPGLGDLAGDKRQDY